VVLERITITIQNDFTTTKSIPIEMCAKLIQSYRNSVSVANQLNTPFINRFQHIWFNYYHQYNLSRYSDIIEQPLFRWMSIRDLPNNSNITTDDEDIYLTRMSYLHAEGQYMPDDGLTHHNHLVSNDEEIVFLTRMSHLHSYCYMKD
jgi:hypothetical protein